uniref:Transglutaminase-like domain-containing protein n=1 Tax=Mycena chlorophos TaxID=658473 RepID=A0ABQ0M2A4_MYCCL|nr:predicted protein [Mycena chlorophos]
MSVALPPRRPVPNVPGRAPPAPPPRKASAPALPPRRQSINRDPNLERLLARKPPPPPTKPAAPGRRLPPMPARLPTPEPEPEPEPVPEEEEPDACVKCHDFSVIDEHASAFPRQSVTSLALLAQQLTEPWSSQTEQVRALFAWLHYNVVYDVEGFFSGNIKSQSPEDTLRSGLAVCDGYAGLFSELARLCGIQAQKVTGYGKGYGYAPLSPGAPIPAESSNHAWNCVQMDGEWRLIDPCWGAGALVNGVYSQKLAPVWFYSTPAEFGKRHFPTDRSFQLLEEPVSWEEFIGGDSDGPMLYGDFYSLEFSPELIQPPVADIQGPGYVNFQLFKQCEHMSREQADNYVYFIVLPDQSKIPLLLGPEGAWGASVYLPQGLTGDISLNFLTMFDGRDARGISPNTFQSGIGRKAMGWQGLCKWNLV